MQYDKDSKQILIKQVTIAIEEFLNTTPRNVSKDWFKSNLTMAQVRMMFLLEELPGSRMGDLANSLGISMPSATGIADQLVNKQLIERNLKFREKLETARSLSKQIKELKLAILQIEEYVGRGEKVKGDVKST